MKKILSILLILFALQAHAEQSVPLPLDQCKIQAPFGFPKSKKSNITPICRKAYFVLHDNKAHIPQYASYVLTPAHSAGCLARSNAFAADKSISADFASTPKDYVKSNYDTGHMVNDGDMRWDLQAEIDSFILSNMAPQLPEFNRGIWKKLEDTTRGWAISRQHDLLIYVGPIYDQLQNPTIGQNRVTIPTAFFKVIIDMTTNEVQVYAMKHEGSKAALDTFIVSLPDLQKQTKLVFPLPKKPIFTKTWDVSVKNATKTKATTCAIN